MTPILIARISIVVAVVVGIFMSLPASATDLTFQFKNPSFNGVGQSAHYLTIDEQERTRKAAILDEIESKAQEVLRAQENTTLARFISNLSSRIFSQISQDLAASLFNSETGGSGGVFDLDGNQITFVNTGTEIILTVTGIDGSVTEVIIPTGTFGVCSAECGI